MLPSYNYKEGILRILAKLESSIRDDVEIIIGDNSTNEEIKEMVSPWVEKFPNSIKYYWNNPYKTPIENWNFLIDEALGEYIWMLHHDEYPENMQTVEKILEKLSAEPLIDVFILNCQLTFAGGNYIRSHFNAKLRNFLLRHNPLYLLHRNIIGPTGILIIRRNLCPRFDLKLIWLVDVDLYVTLFLKNIKWASSDDLLILSEQERTSSLTKGLGKSVRGIRAAELTYLQNRMHSRDIWLGPYPGESIARKLVRFFEVMIWLPYRLISKSSAYIRYRLRLS